MLQRHVSPCVVILLKIMHLGSCANFVPATCRTKLKQLKFALFVGTKLLHNSRCTRVKYIIKHYEACCCNTCHWQMSLLHFLPCVQLFILSLSYFLATRPCCKPFSEYGTGFLSLSCYMTLQHVAATCPIVLWHPKLAHREESLANCGNFAWSEHSTHLVFRSKRGPIWINFLVREACFLFLCEFLLMMLCE